MLVMLLARLLLMQRIAAKWLIMTWSKRKQRCPLVTNTCIAKLIIKLTFLAMKLLECCREKRILLEQMSEI